MAAVMLGAVMLGQRAITLRGVAIAAILILVISPEALLGPGFQMSFAATTALVAVFALLRDVPGPRGRAVQWAFALFVSSAVAGAATAPFAAAHFNRFADYGLIANLASVPLMGSVVMPGAIAAAIGAPFGLEGPGLWVMKQGLAWIVGVAHWVAGLEGSVTRVPAPPWTMLPLLTVGALFALLWQGRARAFGAVPAVLAAVLWVMTERPVVLIAESGGLVGALGPEGRALSKPRGEGFAARSWLENDGDGADQGAAAGRGWQKVEGGARVLETAGYRLLHVSGKRALAAVPARCKANEIWVFHGEAAQMPKGPCQVFAPEALRKTGALALKLGPDGARVTATRPAGLRRVWQPQ